MDIRRGAVVVVGSLHYDLVIEAPRLPLRGETLAGRSWRPKFGGKGGNQAVAAAGFGAETRMLSAVGADEFGAFLRDGLARAGVASEFVAVLPESGSGMSVAISEEGGDYGAVIVSGANLGIDPTCLARPDLWRGAAILVLQNEVAEAVNVAAARQARLAGVRVCLNAAPARPLSPELAGLVDILVANAIEAEALTGLPVADLGAGAAAAAALAGRFPVAVVTAGGAGVALSAAGCEPVALPAYAVEVVSTHGAGDVFVGTFCAALAGGRGLDAALAAANERAARHVSGGGHAA